MYYLLLYEVIDDYVKRRAPYRDEHLRIANEAAQKGQLMLGGPLTILWMEPPSFSKPTTAVRSKISSKTTPMSKTGLLRIGRSVNGALLSAALCEPGSA